MTSRVKVAGVQMDVALGRVAENLQQVLHWLEQAAAAGAQLVVFPECALTGYCFESLSEAIACAEPLDGPGVQQLTAACAKLNVHCVVGTLERDGERIFNVALLVGPQGLVAAYRKIHLPGLGVDRFVTPGDREPAVHEVAGLRVGLAICYDGSFPEHGRCLMLAGADIICLPTNWPSTAAAVSECQVASRAIENHLYFLAVNRIGTERGFEFQGRSRLCGVSGEDLADRLGPVAGILIGEIDYEVARNKHLVRVPGKHEIHRLHDRRPEMYGRLVEPVVRETKFPQEPHPPEEPQSPESSDALHAQLWAPWRLAYVAPKKPPALYVRPAPPTGAPDFPPDIDNCFLCRAAHGVGDDRENMVVQRTEHTVTVLNRYPYNNGHLLVAPRAHKGRLDQLTAAEHTECMQTIAHLIQLMERMMNAEGFNVGLNCGRVAGAGLPGHLHWHIVPRWHGDVNFMPVLAGIRVLPQSLDALWQLLHYGLVEEANS